MESHKVKSIVAIWVTAALLAACGGGDGSSINTGGSSAPVYATWSGSSNNDVIMDANNERFGVRLSDRTVVADNGNIALTGLTVDEQGNVYRSGQKIGVVSLVAASDGSQIAAFKNLDGTLMDIQISNGSYLIAPSTNSGSGSGSSSGSGSGSQKTGPSAASCISETKNSSGNIVLTNNCQVTVEISWCYINGPTGSVEDTYKCAPSNSYWSPTGQAYSTQGGGWSPGFSMEVTYYSQTRIAFAACAAPYIIPIITEVDLINNKVYSYCVDPS